MKALVVPEIESGADTGAKTGAGTDVEAVPVDVFLPALLRAAAGGAPSVRVEASTLQGSLDALCRGYPKLATHLFDERGELRPHVNIFLNDDNVRWLESWSIPVRSGDSVTILQAVSGG